MTRKILTTREASLYTSLSESWLEKMRLRGDGPAFVRLGVRRVGYEIDALDRWLDRQRERAPDGGEPQVRAEH